MSMILGNGVLFYHIPRTGGTYVKYVYRRLGLHYLLNGRKHAPIATYRRKHRLRIKAVFTVVRHPCLWYESTWRWLQWAGPSGREWVVNCPWHPHRPAAMLWEPVFDAWVERMLYELPGYAGRVYDSFCGARDDELCFFIGRTYSITEDVVLLLSSLGVARRAALCAAADIPPVNAVGGEIAWRDSALWMRVEVSESAVIERFYEGAGREQRFYVGGVKTLAQKLVVAG